MTHTILKSPGMVKGFLITQTSKLNGILDGCNFKFKYNWCQSLGVTLAGSYLNLYQHLRRASISDERCQPFQN